MSTTEELAARERARPRRGLRADWLRAHAAFAAVLVAFVLAYRASIVDLIGVWANSGMFQYAFLIFPISAFLIWLRRPVLRSVSPRFSLLGIAGLGVVSLIWLMGAVVSAAVAQHFSLVAAVPLAVLACYGRPVVNPLIFPLAYLFFALPFGTFLVVPLQNFTAAFSVWALQVSGATVFMEGHLIHMPVGTFEVAEACSGIKFFLATTALGTLYAYLFYNSWLRRALFVLAAIAAPIIANGLRVYFTILIGQYFGMEHATGLDHLVFGWQFFGTVLVLLFLAGWFWREPPRQETPVSSPPSAIRPGPARGLVYTAAAAGFLVFGPVLAAATAGSAYVPGPAQRLPPATLAGGAWGVAATSVNPLGSRFEAADAVLSGVYGAGRAGVAVYSAIYDGPPQGPHDVLHSANRIYRPDAWTWLGGGEHTVAGITFSERRLRGPSEDRLVWYWYRVGGHTVADPIRAKLLQAWSRLTGGDTRSGVLVLSTTLEPGRLNAARERLSGFVTNRRDALRALGAGRGGS